MRRKQGFTLIEILSTIVILSIVALITVPRIIGVIDNVRKNAYKESVRSIFKAVDIYMATNEFTDFPEEGIDVTDEKLQMKYKDFVSGKIITNEEGELELRQVSNGIYCAGGALTNIIVVKGSCDELDITPPIVAINYKEVKSNLVTIIGIAEDLESGVSSYQFSKDNGLTWTEKQESNEYTFTGLTNNIDYSFKVRAYNSKGLMGESEVLIVRTTDIGVPTYTVDTTDWSKTKTVTIHYPERQENYIYEYSLDNALSWIAIEDTLTTKDILFTGNGSIIARILDGTNEISGSLMTISNIDLINPSITLALVGNPFNEEGWARNNIDLSVNALDSESGIDYYKYCSTTSETCTPNQQVNNDIGVVTITTEGTNNRVCVKSYDKVGNESEVICSNSYKLDKSLPTVVYNPNSNTAYQKSHSTTVMANDILSELKQDSLKYLWGKSLDFNMNEFETGFTNNSTLTTPVGGSGSYYLGVLAMDKAGNTSIQTSGVFNIDNLKPDVTDITLSPSSVTATSFTINRSGNAVDMGGSGLPASPYMYQISLDKSVWVTKCTSNSTSCNASGLTTGLTYYYRVCVVDNAGNEGCTNSNTITPVSGYYCGPLSGTTVAGDVLSGKTFYNSSGLQTGTMPNNGSQSGTLTITGSSKPTKTIPSGYTSGGTVTAQLDPSLAPNIKGGVNIGGVAGTMPNNGSQSATLTITGGSKPSKTIPSGYTSGGTVTAQLDPSLASSIQKGVTIGGVKGTGYMISDDYIPVSQGEPLTIISGSNNEKDDKINVTKTMLNKTFTKKGTVTIGISATNRGSNSGATSRVYVYINDVVVMTLNLRSKWYTDYTYNGVQYEKPDATGDKVKSNTHYLDVTVSVGTTIRIDHGYTNNNSQGVSGSGSGSYEILCGNGATLEYKNGLQ